MDLGMIALISFCACRTFAVMRESTIVVPWKKAETKHILCECYWIRPVADINIGGPSPHTASVVQFRHFAEMCTTFRAKMSYVVLICCDANNEEL